jgi:dienelactone hydrolase
MREGRWDVWRAWRWGALALASAGLAGLVACAVFDPKDATPTPTPTSTTTPIAWLERIEVSRADGIVVEKVAYRSGTLKIWAEIFRPEGAVNHTLLLWNHGGFAGLVDGDRSFCRALVKFGFVVAASYYRGEGGSEGHVEACKGEVDDVQALLAILKTQDYVDPTHVGTLGASHGGCVALSVAIRQPDIRVAVDLAGPSDWAALHAWMTDQLAHGEPFCAQIGRTDCAALHRDLVREIEGGFGGTPAQVPQAYADRSPVQHIRELNVPTLWVHGADDVIVNVDQTCRKRAALSEAGRAPSAWYVDRKLSPVSSGGSVCGGGFQQTPVLLFALGETNAVVIYEGQGHELKDTSRDHVVALVAGFVAAHLR